ncbi:MAG: metal ABC transporter permease, partial [Thermomicrobiales bacterium]
TVAVLAAIVVTLIALFYKELLYLTFDEQSARAAGLPALAVNTLLAGLAAITTVAAMQIVGLLLVSSLMVLPALTAIRLAKSFRGTLAIAVAAALIAVLVGLTLSFYLDSAPGGTIVLSALAVFGLASLAERRSQVTSPQVTSLFGRRTG